MIERQWCPVDYEVAHDFVQSSIPPCLKTWATRLSQAPTTLRTSKPRYNLQKRRKTVRSVQLGLTLLSATAPLSILLDTAGPSTGPAA